MGEECWGCNRCRREPVESRYRKQWEKEIRKEEAGLHASDVADGDVANILNVAETYEAGVANITSNEGQVGVC